MTRKPLLIAALSAALAGGCGDSQGGASDASTDGGEIVDAQLALVDAFIIDAPPPHLDAGFDSGVASNFPTLDDYLRCTTGTDCPIDMGDCVTEVPYNRVDIGGVHTVALSDIDSSFAPGEGICTRTCTTDADACSGLTLKNAVGDDIEFQCQVVVTGVAPYNSPGSFPFHVPKPRMNNGQPFGAVCRPPFDLDPDRIDGFCGSCTDSGDCGTGLCWDVLPDEEATAGGTCFEGCSNADPCPFGFTCETLDLEDGSTGEFCRPVADTCGDCQDRDGDGVGAGRCASPSVDCDDRNPAAYYDASNMDHPFPQTCGVVDLNCNGKSDDTEVIGNNLYADTHCESCNDDCAGTVVNGTGNIDTLNCTGAEFAKTCVAECAVPADEADCDANPHNGCETSGASGGDTHYRDADGDTFGDVNAPQVACAGQSAKPGYVDNSTDCDDTNDPRGTATHPGGTEVCDGDYTWRGGDFQPTLTSRGDNDCDGAVDEGVKNTYYYDRDKDGWGTNAALEFSCTVPGAQWAEQIGDCANQNPLRHPGMADTCNGVDDDCDGEVDENVLTTYYRDADGDGYGDPDDSVLACTHPGNPGDYVENSDDCEGDADATINPDGVEICDDFDNDCNDLLNDGIDDSVSCTVPALQGACAAGAGCAGGACVQIWQPSAFDDPGTPEADDNCNGVDWMNEIAIYVDADNGLDGAGDGTSGSPYKTLGKALLEAGGDATVTAIYLHAGTSGYVLSAEVTMVPGVSILGGFDRTNGWTHSGAVKSRIVRNGTASAGRVAALRCSNIAQATPTALAYLSIEVNQSADPGVSHYGIHANTCHGLHLKDVSISVAAGSAGTPGDDGATGNGGAAATGPDGAMKVCPSPTGANTDVSGGGGGTAMALIRYSPFGIFDVVINGFGGHGGTGGDGGIVCAYTNSSYLCRPVIDGAVSTSLWPGQLGGAVLVSARDAAGAGAGGLSTTVPHMDGGGFWNNPGAYDAVRGLHGAGGGGGAGDWLIQSTGGDDGGGGGSGACGGEHGLAGQGGGSAFGIFAISSVNMSFAGSITISVGDGGVAGDGGDGGSGGNGAWGKTAATAWAADYNATGGAPGSGGSGGGGGGGGNGGISVAVFSTSLNSLCDRITLGTGDGEVNVSFPGSTENPSGGAGGSAGSGGVGPGGGNGSIGGLSGDTGGAGWQDACYWSRPCSQGCAADESCQLGNCVRNPQ